jgi:hypothetical protein
MRHIISQEHHMEEGTPSDEEYMTERSEDEEINHILDMVENRRPLANCCMKTTLKKIINYLVYKPLTYIETMILCVYQFMLMWTLMAIALEYNVVQFCLAWVFDDILRKDFIVLCAMVINSMIVVDLCDDIWQLIGVFSCKCKKD